MDKTYSIKKSRTAPVRLGGGKRKNRSLRKDRRREEALVRQAAREARSDEEQLNLLVDRGVITDCLNGSREAKKLLSRVGVECWSGGS